MKALLVYLLAQRTNLLIFSSPIDFLNDYFLLFTLPEVDHFCICLRSDSHFFTVNCAFMSIVIFLLCFLFFYWWESFHIKKLSTFSLLWTYTSPQLFVICLWHGLKWRKFLFLCSQIYLVLLLWLLGLCETEDCPFSEVKKKKSCFLLILSGFDFYV